MIALHHTAISCANHACTRRGEPFAYLDLGAGDSVKVRCPACGWLSTLHVQDGGQLRVERQSGSVAGPERARKRTR